VIKSLGEAFCKVVASDLFDEHLQAKKSKKPSQKTKTEALGDSKAKKA
jgi:hypothetical protein